MPHISRRAIACATLASSLAAAICLAVAAPRLSAGSESPFVGFPCPSNAALTCVMKQLDGVRGLAFGPDGALYVAEAGHGGSGPCITESGARVCYGPSGAITRLWDDGQERILTGLPSLAVNDPLTPGRTGQAANGPTDVSFPHHSGEDQGLAVAAVPAGVDGELIAAAPGLLSLLARWAALDGGAWHVEWHAREKAELLAETRAALAAH